MTQYVVVGHPLNINDLGLTNPDAIRAALQLNGVGQTVTLTLTGPDDTKVKAHRLLR